jgi:hypothetical protein
VERRKDRLFLADRTECLVQSFEWIAYLQRERCLLVGLILAKHHERSGFEIDVTPANTIPTLVVRIAEDLALQTPE